MYLHLALIWGGLFIFVIVAKLIISLLLTKYAENKDSSLARHLNNDFKILPIPFWIVSASYFTLMYFDIQILNPEVFNILFAILTVVLSIFFAIFFSKSSNAVFNERIEKEKDRAKKEYFNYIKTIVKLLIWILGLGIVLLLNGHGTESLLIAAGLIALIISVGYKTFFSDVFSSFVIILTSPFKAGDYVKYREHEGKIKAITLRDTVIREVDGREIHISNTKLLSREIINFEKKDYVELEYKITLGGFKDFLTEELFKDMYGQIIKKEFFKKKFRSKFVHVSTVQDKKKDTAKSDENVYILRFYGGIREIDVYEMSSEILVMIKGALEEEYSSNSSAINVEFTDKKAYK